MAFSSSMLRNVIAGLEGADVATHRALQGIVDQSMLGKSFWLPDDDFFEFVTRAARMSQHPTLGLSIGQRGGNWAGFGAPGLYVNLTRTFADAVNAMVCFNRATRDRQDVFVEQDERQLTVQFGPFDAPRPARQLLGDIGMAAMCQLLQRFAGPNATPLRVSLDYPAPGRVDEHASAFGCDVMFDQPRTSLMVSRTLADKEQLIFQPELAEQMRRLAEACATGGAEAAQCMAERVRACMRRGWHSDTNSMSEIARELGVSERSLRRHLAREGLGFRSLLAQGRLEVAREMLRNGLAVKQIADQLGYRSTTAFHRAFRRWAGATPMAFALGERRFDAAGRLGPVNDEPSARGQAASRELSRASAAVPMRPRYPTN